MKKLRSGKWDFRIGKLICQRFLCFAQKSLTLEFLILITTFLSLPTVGVCFKLPVCGGVKKRETTQTYGDGARKKESCGLPCLTFKWRARDKNVERWLEHQRDKSTTFSWQLYCRVASRNARADAHTSSLGSRLSSSLNAAPTRLLTWGGFSPTFSGYSFGILPVSSCKTGPNRQGDNWHRPGLSNTKWSVPQTREDTHSLPQTDLLKLLDFLQEFFLQELLLLPELEDFLPLLLLTNFWVLRTWRDWEGGQGRFIRGMFPSFLKDKGFLSETCY